MTEIVVPEFLPERHIGLLAEAHEVRYDPDLYGRRVELLSEMGDARAVLIRNRTRIDVELLDASPGLEVVGRLGVGLDNIDMEAASRSGVEVIPAVGGNAVSVAEYAIGAMLVLWRGVYSMTASMQRGEWPRQGHAFGRELLGKRLGLLGYGSIARLVAERALGLGMMVQAHDPFIPPDADVWGSTRPVGLEELFGTSDVVSIHIPLTEDTRGLVGERALQSMPPGAIVVNTARGGVVDEEALVAALREGHLGGAALDVFEVEPLGPGPAARFADVPNLLLTPHVAGNTAESVDRVATMTVEAVLARLG